MEDFWVKLQKMKESLSFIAPPDIMDTIKTIEDHWQPICESANKSPVKPTDYRDDSPVKLRRSGRRKSTVDRENVENQLTEELPLYRPNYTGKRRGSVASEKSLANSKKDYQEEEAKSLSKKRIVSTPLRDSIAARRSNNSKSPVKTEEKPAISKPKDTIQSKSPVKKEDKLVAVSESKKGTSRSRSNSVSYCKSKSPTKKEDKLVAVSESKKGTSRSRRNSLPSRKSKSPTKKEDNLVAIAEPKKKTIRSKEIVMYLRGSISSVEKEDMSAVVTERKGRTTRSRTTNKKKENPTAVGPPKKTATRSTSATSNKFKSPIVNDEKPTEVAMTKKTNELQLIESDSSTKSEAKPAFVAKLKKAGKTTPSFISNKVARFPKSQLDESLSTLILNKNNIEKKNKKGESVLHSACIKNNIEIVEGLLAMGANPNTKDFANWTPLHEVINKKFMDIAKLLLEHGASPNIPGPFNEIVLHDVVRNNQIETCILLIERGADIHARNSQGVTPLDLAKGEIREVLLNTNRKHNVKDLLLTSIINIELNFEIRVLPSFLKPENMSKLEKLMKHHTNIIIEKTVSNDTTFLIVESYDEKLCPTDINTLNAVVLGIPIFRSEWLSDCNESHLAILKEFELSFIGGYRDCITLAYRNRLNLMPPLFNGCHFYFKGLKKNYEISASLKVGLDLLVKIINNGGGKVLRREPDAEFIPESEQLLPYHVKEDSMLSKCSHFILYGTKPEMCYNMLHIKSLPIGWLIECIQNFMLIDTDLFFHN